MKSRLTNFCTPSHGCEECRAASRASLLFPFRWVRDELRTWASLEWLATLWCVVAVFAAWFGGNT